MADYPTRIDLAFQASCLRDELDELLKRYDARLLLGWDGKWAKVQVMFPATSRETVVTIMETKRGGTAHYVLQEEEKK